METLGGPIAKSELDFTGSKHAALLHRFQVLAEEHCASGGLEAGAVEALSLNKEAYDTATTIAVAFEGLPSSRARRKFLSQSLDLRTENFSVPKVPNDLAKHDDCGASIEGSRVCLPRAVLVYVRGRLKAGDVDRMLVQAIIESEIMAYLQQVLGKCPTGGVGQLNENRPLSLVRSAWRVGKLAIAAYLTSIGIILGSVAIGLFSITVGKWVGIFLLLASFLLLTTLALALLDIKNENRKRGAQRSLITSRIEEMRAFFVELDADNEIATFRLKRRMIALSELGIFWPDGLVELVADIERREPFEI